MTRPIRFYAVIALTLLACYCMGTPAFAQDMTATVEATPPAAVIIPSTDQTTVIPGTASTPTIIVEPSASYNPIILVVGSVILLIVGFVLNVSKGKNPDTAAVDQVEVLRHNEVTMDNIRAGYEHSSAQTQAALDTLKTVVSSIAPWTPFKIDDELALLLKDITDPDIKAAVVAAAQAAVARSQSSSAGQS